MRDNKEYCDGKLMERGEILKFMKSESRSIVTLNLHFGENSTFRSTEGAPGRSRIRVYVSAMMNNRSVLGSARRTLREPPHPCRGLLVYQTCQKSGSRLKSIQ